MKLVSSSETEPWDSQTNRCQAKQRLEQLCKKLKGNATFLEHNLTFVSNIIDQGYASKILINEVDCDDGKVWYLPHHGIYHPKKRSKITVVFDF